MEIENKQKKKPYSTPKIVVYGNIQQLTQADNGGRDFDNATSPPFRNRDVGMPSR